MSPGRWAALAALVFALYFAVQGGEYGTSDLIALRRQESSERDQVERLRLVVDSLQHEATAIWRCNTNLATKYCGCQWDFYLCP